MSDILTQISDAVIKGSVQEAPGLVKKALDEGNDAQKVLDNGLFPGMNVVGARFKKGEMFIPEVILAAKTMQSGLEVLRPHLSSAGAKAMGTVVIGTVKGDLHDIGKNLVVMMLEGAGFTVHDLGRDVSAEAFVESVRKFKPDIVGMSALLTTTMRGMESVVGALKQAGLREGVKIMVGGAPITSEFAKMIGADAYSASAPAAADTARKLIARA
jgi:5-methyltetrahydrofolate--homocysteine methyltransferase